MNSRSKNGDTLPKTIDALEQNARVDTPHIHHTVAEKSKQLPGIGTIRKTEKMGNN